MTGVSVRAGQAVLACKCTVGRGGHQGCCRTEEVGSGGLPAGCMTSGPGLGRGTRWLTI